eukprot:Hpha_TRINITY_DN4079_c0_g1::TRINITY_DN4079_c0_g1_i1::g.63709::m.63709
MLLRLRPTIAFVAVLGTAVSLAGGLTVYFSAQDAVDTVVVFSQASLRESLGNTIQLFNETLQDAKDNIERTIDSASSADTQLFGEKMRLSFTNSVLNAQILVRSFILEAPLLQRPQLEDLMTRRLCGQIKANALDGHSRTSGAGISITPPLAQLGTKNKVYMDTFCWWDPTPGGGQDWFFTGTTFWKDELGAYVTPAYSVTNETTFARESEAFDHYIEYNETDFELTLGEWTSPQTWLADSGLVANYFAFSKVELVDVPPDHFLHGGRVRVETELDLAHWTPIIKEFLETRNPEGSFVVADFKHRLVFAHTSEPAPDMSLEPACQEGESLDGLGILEESACFPTLDRYSNTTYALALAMQNVTDNILTKVPLCSCNGSVILNCSDPCGSTSGYEVFYARKGHIFSVGPEQNFSLHVMWFRDSAELSGEIEQRTKESRDQLRSHALLIERQAVQTESEANRRVDWALMIMICTTVAAFVLSVATSVMWLVLLASPLSRLEDSVSLMGNVQVDEAVARFHEGRNNCVEVYEVRSIGHHFLNAAAHLKEYRSYLPQGITELGLNPAAHIEPPSGRVAFVFTDIQSSTMLWEMLGMDMDVALTEHNQVLRRNIAVNKGYEVKTIGDAFMVAFSDVVEAARCCLQCQLDLRAISYPSTFEDHPATCKQEDTKGRVIWAGLRVRMGIHFGEVGQETNPLTGRADYRGPTVNKAARLEQTGWGGLLAVGMEVHEMLQQRKQDVLQGQIKWMDAGHKDMKGLGMQQVYTYVPVELAERLEVVATNPFRRSVQLVQNAHGMELDRNLSDSSVTSGWSDNTSGTGGTAVSKLATRLEMRDGVVCMISLGMSGFNSENIPSFEGLQEYGHVVYAVSDMLRRTGGALLFMSGTVLQGSWNTVKPCDAWLLQSLVFTQGISSRMCKDRRDRGIALGLASGMLLTGNAGIQTRRSPIVTGLPSLLSSALAEHAWDLGADVLAISLSSPNVLLSYGRCVDLWEDCTRETTLLQVIQPVSKRVKSIDVTDLWSFQNVAHPNTEEQMSQLHLLQLSISGDEDATTKLATEAKEECDTVMLSVLKSLGQSTANGARITIPGQARRVELRRSWVMAQSNASGNVLPHVNNHK